MNLQLEKTGPRMFGRRLAFALARRRATGSVPAKRTITVPRSLDTTESSMKPAEGKLSQS
ncbi:MULTISPECIES: hypothetical protein [Luteibacter]|uniref:Uncharacterized protein n=1 Tax=Luteibacter flocculans TaxID=2780091 RepID=A0ABY4T2H8_9GAMM|nr:MULTISPECIES: hypothetical protein [Luteibacter]URL58821.1 hypothetical protein IM816_01470 [Luteibacter flocculans]SFW75385.1 hypothetical protein SAMN02800691_3544 [Luteibacter sp. UNCMF366Tsu5.1]